MQLAAERRIEIVARRALRAAAHLFGAARVHLGAAGRHVVQRRAAAASERRQCDGDGGRFSTHFSTQNLGCERLRIVSRRRALLRRFPSVSGDPVARVRNALQPKSIRMADAGQPTC
jgi:hypothetical protein